MGDRAIRARLSSINTEMEIMVLEIQTDTRKVDNRLHAHLLELLGVTDAGTLKDEW